MTLLGTASIATSSRDDAQPLAGASTPSHRSARRRRRAAALPPGMLTRQMVEAELGMPLDEALEVVKRRARAQAFRCALEQLRREGRERAEHEALLKRQHEARAAMADKVAAEVKATAHVQMRLPLISVPRARAARPKRAECSGCTRSSDGGGDPPPPAVAEALAALEAWRPGTVSQCREPGRWVANCPACDRRSLRVVENGDDVIRRCVAGCSPQEIECGLEVRHA